MKTRMFAGLLCLLMLLSMLCGCETDKKQPKIGTTPVSDDKPGSLSDKLQEMTAQTPDDPPKAPEQKPEEEAPEQPADAEKPSVPEAENQLHAWELKTEEQAKWYYAGDWMLYVPGCWNNMLWMTLSEDGTYRIELDTEEIILGYSGSWDVFETEGYETPFALHLGEAVETNDSMFAGWPSIGDFIFEELTLCDGLILANPVQLNNGESILSEHFGLDTPMVMTRNTEQQVTAKRHMNDTFYAHLWKSRYGCSSEPGDFGFGEFVIFVDDVTLLEDDTIVNTDRQSVPYIVGEGNDENLSGLSGGPDGVYAYGDEVYRVTVNENSEIVDAEFVPTKPAPSEEEALQLLENFEEVRFLLNEGKSVLSEGTDILYGEKAIFIAFGDDLPEQFVITDRYAVSASRFVYCYNAADDDWYWIEPVWAY